MYDVENLCKLFHSYGDNQAFSASRYVNRIQSIFMRRASIILFIQSQTQRYYYYTEASHKDGNLIFMRMIMFLFPDIAKDRELRRNKFVLEINRLRSTTRTEPKLIQSRSSKACRRVE